MLPIAKNNPWTYKQTLKIVCFLQRDQTSPILAWMWSVFKLFSRAFVESEYKLSQLRQICFNSDLCLSVSVSFSVCLTVCLSVSLSLSLCLCLFFCLSDCLSVSLSVSVSEYISAEESMMYTKKYKWTKAKVMFNDMHAAWLMYICLYADLQLFHTRLSRVIYIKMWIIPEKCTNNEIARRFQFIYSVTEEKEVKTQSRSLLVFDQMIFSLTHYGISPLSEAGKSFKQIQHSFSNR